VLPDEGRTPACIAQISPVLGTRSSLAFIVDAVIVELRPEICAVRVSRLCGVELRNSHVGVGEAVVADDHRGCHDEVAVGG
jgi:hypothetical protein